MCKKLNIFAFLFFLLPSINSWAQSTCSEPDFSNQTSLTTCDQFSNCSTYNHTPAVGNPYIYEGDCTIGLNRYLSRAIDAGFIAELNFNNDFNNLHCNDISYFRYCPQRYCELIQSFVDLDIQMIQRAFPGAAGHEHDFFPGEIWYELGAKIVRDINHAYDCAGKRRPIIQGGILEYSVPSNFDAMVVFNLNPINRHLPCWVINKYFDEYPEDKNAVTMARYFTGDIPKDNIFFEAKEIYSDNFAYVDITKVEARMWFLYQAWTMIKMGYTSIHTGVYWAYAVNDTNYDALSKLTEEIREYAADNGSFVLISGETPMQDVDGGLTAIHDGKFIFDIDSRAMRPRETQNNVSGDGNNCNAPVDPALVTALNNSPCPQSSYAVIDFCTINSFGGSGDGPNYEHPLGCDMPMLPYTIHFDGFSTPQNPGVASNGPNSLTYGYNDHQWFSSLPDDCKVWWYDYFYCHVAQNYHNGMGHVIIPGIIAAIPNVGSGNYDVPTTLHLINETPNFVSTLANNTLAVKKPEILIEEVPSCQNGHPVPFCNNQWGCFFKNTQKYKISVKNKDCSSTYSIHVKSPDGTWLSQEIGTEYIITPPVSGTYQIGIRQDNLAIPDNFGVYTVEKTVYLNRFCCQPTPDYIPNCNESGKIVFSASCTGAQDEYFIQEFVIEAQDISIDNISNIRPADPLSSVIVAHSEAISTKKIKGTILSKEDASYADLLIDFYHVGSPQLETSLISTILHNCNEELSEERSNKNTEDLVKIYPNPAAHSLYLSIAGYYKEKINLNIYNSRSNGIYSEILGMNTTKTEYVIDVSNWAGGVYFLELKSESVTKVFKIVVIN